MLLQLANSVLQFIIPKATSSGGAPTTVAVAPSDDTYVAAGGNSGANYGTATTMAVALSTSSAQEGTSAALIKFPISQFSAGKVCQEPLCTLNAVTFRMPRLVFECYVPAAGASSHADADSRLLQLRHLASAGTILHSLLVPHAPLEHN